MINFGGMPTYKIELEPVGRRTEIEAGLTLLEAAQTAGVELIATCGGQGICEGCRVRVENGKLTPLTLEEEALFSCDDLSKGYRLACQAKPLSDCKIEILPESLTTPQRLQLEGNEQEVELDPVVKSIELQIPAPTLHDLRSDVVRVKEKLLEQGMAATDIAYPVSKNLSETLRSLNWHTRISLHTNEPGNGKSTIVAALPPPDKAGSTMLGLAVDVGTTKLAAYLVNLDTGETLARAGAMNPQIGYGEDVISRIMVANDRVDGRQILQTRLVETLNDLVIELCNIAGMQRDQIVDAVVVGNTVMHHLFAGFPVRQLGAAPYVASVSEPVNIRSHDLGLNIAPGAFVYLPPNIAGYVGADHVSMLLASETVVSKGIVIALDIGTNTEVSVVREGRILSCSCASGPAFEGAHITFGMRAAPGAIERVQIVDGKVLYHTIGGQPAVGICGSGILDAVAVLLEAGVIDTKGNMDSTHPLVRTRDGKREVILTPAEKTGHGRDVVVTRHDVNEIQLAKGAIRAGIEVLVAEAGGITDSSQLDGLIVAGAFGTYLDLGSAIRVGMFPHLPMERFRQVGNAAGSGARQMLLSAERRDMAAQIAKKVEYIELTTHSRFTEFFIKSILF